MDSDLLTGIGLTLTLFGSGYAAFSVILSKSDAVKIGMARYGSDNYEENLKLPVVQNLLASSRGAKRGLILVAIGTFFQLVPIVVRLLE